MLPLLNGEDDPYDQQFMRPMEACKASVKFAFGSFNNEFVRNLLKAVIVTIHAAQIWSVADKIGSVQEGRVAS